MNTLKRTHNNTQQKSWWIRMFTKSFFKKKDSNIDVKAEVPNGIEQEDLGFLHAPCGNSIPDTSQVLGCVESTSQNNTTTRKKKKKSVGIIGTDLSAASGDSTFFDFPEAAFTNDISEPSWDILGGISKKKKTMSNNPESGANKKISYPKCVSETIILDMELYRQRIVELENQLMELTNKYDQLNNNLENTEKTHNDYMKSITTQTNKAHELQSRIETLARENAMLIKQTEEANSALREEIESKRSLENNFKQVITEKEQQIAELEATKNTQSDIRIKDLEARLKDSEKARDKLAESLQEELKEKEVLKSAQGDLIDKLKVMNLKTEEMSRQFSEKNFTDEEIRDIVKKLSAEEILKERKKIVRLQYTILVLITSFLGLVGAFLIKYILPYL